MGELQLASRRGIHGWVFPRWPIIMVTVRADEVDCMAGPDLGVDDYVVRPFSSTELVARVRAVLRRTQPGGEAELLAVHDLQPVLSGQRVRSEWSGGLSAVEAACMVAPTPSVTLDQQGLP